MNVMVASRMVPYFSRSTFNSLHIIISKASDNHPMAFNVRAWICAKTLSDCFMLFKQELA